MTRPVLLDDAYIDDPYPQLARWRCAAGWPLVRLRYGVSARLITRFDDAQRVLDSPVVSKDVRRGLRLLESSAQASPILSEHMLNADAPHHGRLRRLAAPAVSHGKPGVWSEVIDDIVTDLVDRLAARKEADLIADMALPLPITLICRMLGVPESDQDMIIGWSVELGRHAAREPVAHATKEFARYLEELLDRKSTCPADDGLTWLAACHATGGLSRSELVSTAFLLLFAGHETTMNLIGNGMFALLSHEPQWRRLCREPALLPNAVEELLRYDSPVSHATIRYLTQDLELDGGVLPKGAFVLVSLAGTNRDEHRWQRAGTLDIGRPIRRHLAFGYGPHHCLGAQIARLQGHIAIGALVRRLPGLRLAVPVTRLTWQQSTLTRGLMSLPVLTGA